jgi:SNF2 family DNA or RNA helicase
MLRLRQLACNARLVDPDATLPSSKLAAFLDIVDGLREGGHRALVFSQFTSHLALVRGALDERAVRYLYLDGRTKVADRAALVRRFQDGEAELFLISLKAGGTGLNLTAADYAVHLDPWWNPAAEDQASDRAHRIGQDRPVTVIRLIARDTIEQTVLALHADKRELADSLLAGSELAGKLSAAELVALMRGGDTQGGEEPEPCAPGGRFQGRRAS